MQKMQTVRTEHGIIRRSISHWCVKAKVRI